MDNSAETLELLQAHAERLLLIRLFRLTVFDEQPQLVVRSANVSNHNFLCVQVKVGVVDGGIQWVFFHFDE